jgi:CHAT domain-containing protein
LAASVYEADALKELFGAEVHSGAAATKEALMGSGTLKLLHLATHGSDRPSIFLANGEELRPSQLVSMRRQLSELRLAFWNCCFSAQLTPEAIDESLGFVAAGSALGAAASLCALWPVEDTSAADLAVLFYKDLTRSGDPHAALAHARAEVANSDPVSAAAYQLYGA